MSPKSCRIKLIKDIDKRWVKSNDAGQLLKEYLNDKVCVSMRNELKLRNNISEILITDKFGGLVAASSDPAKFYLVNEKWWKESFNDGMGKIYAGDIETNEKEGQQLWSELREAEKLLPRRLTVAT